MCNARPTPARRNPHRRRSLPARPRRAEHRSAHTAFHARVAARALELVRRQGELAQAGEAAELARLRRLLGRDGTLAELNAALADALGAGDIDLHTPGVADHLRATTLEKLAVDQPDYSGYRAALAKGA